MIKEKDIFCYEKETQLLNEQALNGAADIAAVRGIVEEYISQNGIGAVISEDMFSYKVGMLKSESTPCIIISHGSEPKDFRKMMIAIKQADGRAVLVAKWCSHSKRDELIEKSEKIDNKADKSVKKSQKAQGQDNLTGQIANGAMSMIQRARSNSAVKKANDRHDIEKEYHDKIRGLVDHLHGSL